MRQKGSKERSNKVAITIDQVAAEAGVSPATVSRVLNGNPKVSPQVQERVNRAITKFNYVPNSNARRLAGGRTGLVVMLLEETNEEFFLNPFWGQVVQGFSSKITEAGMYPILLIHPRTSDEDELFATLNATKIDGLAIFSWHRPLKNLNKIFNMDMAIVFGGDLGGSLSYPYVDVDNTKGGFIATKHLLERGCKRIIHITGDLRLQSGRDRLSGYEKALKKSGIEIDEQMIFHGDYTQSKAEELAREIIRKKIKFDGVFAANDQSAMGVINILLQNGVKIPNKVKVVGFDNSPQSSKNSPSITTIHQPIRELGSEVATSLLQLINGEAVQNKQIDIKLIKRESSN